MPEYLLDWNAELCCAKLADFCLLSSCRIRSEGVAIAQRELLCHFLEWEVVQRAKGERLCLWVSEGSVIGRSGSRLHPTVLALPLNTAILLHLLILYCLVGSQGKRHQASPVKKKNEFFRKSYQYLCTPKLFVINKLLFTHWQQCVSFLSMPFPRPGTFP